MAKQPTAPISPSSQVNREKEDIEIMELLSPKRHIDLKIEEALDSFDKPFSAILLMPKDQYEMRYARLVKHFLDSGAKGVCVTVNKSSFDLDKILEREEIPRENLIYIDAVTEMIDSVKLKGKQAVYLASPSDLVDISIAIEKAVKKLDSQKKFVIVDSLTTLLVYNNEVSVEKFTHSLSQKIGEWGIQGVFLATDSTSKTFLDTLSQFCDKISQL
jgi:hypothetical protein